MHRTDLLTPTRAALLCAALCTASQAPLAAQEVEGVFAQPYDAAGAKVGAEITVAADGMGEETPVVAALAGNTGFVVVWAAETSEEGGADIVGRRFAGDGTAVGSVFAVNSYTTGSQRRPAVAGAADGGFFVTWDSPNPDGEGRGVFAQLFGADGAPVGSELQVNGETMNAQRRSAVARTADGDFIVAWESGGQDGSDLAIFGRRYGTDATPMGEEFLVNTYTVGDQGRPAVTGLAAGGFVIAWESTDQDNYGRGVFAQRFDDDEMPLGQEFRINTDPLGAQRRPALAALIDGGFVAAWDSGGQDGSGRGVFAQRFDSDGAFSGGEIQVNLHTNSHQQTARVAGLANGGFLIAWESQGQDGNSWGLFAQHFDATGARQGGELNLPTETRHSERFVDIAASEAGIMAVWERRQFCPGDCDGDGLVGVSELVQAVGVALGRTGVGQCSDADANADDQVSVAELTRAVRAALNGC